MAAVFVNNRDSHFGSQKRIDQFRAGASEVNRIVHVMNQKAKVINP
jgi:hypothetical protein